MVAILDFVFVTMATVGNQLVIVSMQLSKWVIY